MQGGLAKSGALLPEIPPSETVVRRRFIIEGTVQGVGFRPFVHRLAQQLGISGIVRNTSRGVLIEAEGALQSVETLGAMLREHLPPQAEIVRILVSSIPAVGAREFTIEPSSEDEAETAAIVPPDLATCDLCVRDFTDPSNRRAGYPFTNCTHCGPRYSITTRVPYDRSVTTMAPFKMCAACQAEYGDPEDRRFHAQPNACPSCGPSLEIEAVGSERSWEDADPRSTLPHARRLMAEGRIVAVKGLGGFQLVCDARNHRAVELLRARKHRPDKPFAVMARDLSIVHQLSQASREEETALLDPARPIVILRRRESAQISPAVAPRNSNLGVMLPYTPLHHLLFGGPAERSEFDVLVMTSGNLSEEPIAATNEEARERLSSIADAFLLHDRDIHSRVDDSVVRVFERQVRVLRRARGYVPRPIAFDFDLGEILAVGGEMKNTLCLTKGRYAFLSQHIGDMGSYASCVLFEQTLRSMRELLGVTPKAVAMDLHPRYRTTQLAHGMEGLEGFAIQHHHAHVASCMADNGLNEKVIGIAWDGTGYGTDGTLWGGEFLVADFAGFERRAHFRNVVLAGGDTAVREPWRAAISYLRDAFGARLPDLPLFKRIAPRTLAAVETALARRLNAVETSSCGRLFDAIASILNLRHTTTYEGQAAIELEAIADDRATDEYSFQLEGQGLLQLDFRPTIEAVVRDATAGVSTALIAARFHHTLAAAAVETCRRIRASDGISKVCLSGGTFQNHFLLAQLVRRLRAADFEVFLHSRVPPNDGGLALGQAVIANFSPRHGSNSQAPFWSGS